MGLLKAILGSAGEALASQWKEYFYCEAMDADVLMTKGIKKTSGRSSNTKGDENVITVGSKIVVADGQCMILAHQGKVVALSAEPGAFEVTDDHTENDPNSQTIFCGKFGKGLLDVFKQIGQNFTFGGVAASDMRIYYVNTKEIMGNKYGTAAPVPFRVVDQRARIDMDIAIKCFGEYSYHISDPIKFYTNVCANVTSEFTRDKIDSQLKTELLTALQPAFAVLSEKGIRYSALPGHTLELGDALNDQLSKKWRELRGIEIVSFGVSSVTADEEDAKKIKQMQERAAYTDPTMAAAMMATAQANAMEAAANNPNGAATAFMGMGMAGNMGGMNAQNLFAMGQQQAAQQAQAAQTQQTAPAAAPANGWKCSCGATATGKFCPECGSPKPADPGFWTCSCGAKNKGKFCAECGSPKPAGAHQYKCDKCGWEPADPANPPKFCPECGDPFGDEDIVK